MNQKRRFLWLDGVFDEDTIKSFPSTSPASNFWQRGFIQGLVTQGCNVDIIGHTHERIWPFGRFIIQKKQASLPEGMNGTVIGYINTPVIRGLTRYINYLLAIKSYLSTYERPDYTVTFSCLKKSSNITASIRIAKYIRKYFGIPWLCVVGDGVAPAGADGYIYLTWSYYESTLAYSPKIHIDGGVPVVRDSVGDGATFASPGNEKILMYMGALTPHGGVSQLARAFHTLDYHDIKLRICGRGENSELTKLASIDSRIELLGFVSEHELNKLASEATLFVNPRPTDFEPNKLNYPSKVLHYLAYEKPIISTFTEGLSPEYSDILIPISEASDQDLCRAILNGLNMSKADYDDMCARIARFNKAHSWAYQVDRALSWLQSEV